MLVFAVLQLKETTRDGVVYTAGVLSWEDVRTGQELTESEVDKVKEYSISISVRSVFRIFVDP